MKLYITLGARFSLLIFVAFAAQATAMADDLPYPPSSVLSGVSNRIYLNAGTKSTFSLQRSVAQIQLRTSEPILTSWLLSGGVHDLMRGPEAGLRDNFPKAHRAGALALDSFESDYQSRQKRLWIDSRGSRNSLQANHSEGGLGAAVFAYLTGHWQPRGYQVTPWIHGGRGGGLSLKSRF